MFHRFSGLLWRSASVRTCQNNDSGLHMYVVSYVYRRKRSVFSLEMSSARGGGGWRRVTNAVIRKTRCSVPEEYKFPRLFALVSERALSTLQRNTNHFNAAKIQIEQ